jgi:hypothetical protein
VDDDACDAGWVCAAGACVLAPDVEPDATVVDAEVLDAAVDAAPVDAGPVAATDDSGCDTSRGAPAPLWWLLIGLGVATRRRAA